MRLLLEHGAVADVYYDSAGSIIPWTSRCRTSVHNADETPDVNAGSEDKMPLHVAASLRGETSAQVLQEHGATVSSMDKTESTVPPCIKRQAGPWARGGTT
jgi:hypothetical protein